MLPPTKPNSNFYRCPPEYTKPQTLPFPTLTSAFPPARRFVPRHTSCLFHQQQNASPHFAQNRRRRGYLPQNGDQRLGIAPLSTRSWACWSSRTGLRIGLRCGGCCGSRRLYGQDSLRGRWPAGVSEWIGERRKEKQDERKEESEGERTSMNGSSDAFIFSGLAAKVLITPQAIWMLSPTVLTWSSMGSTLSWRSLL